MNVYELEQLIRDKIALENLFHAVRKRKENPVKDTEMVYTYSGNPDLTPDVFSEVVDTLYDYAENRLEQIKTKIEDLINPGSNIQSFESTEGEAA